MTVSETLRMTKRERLGDPFIVAGDRISLIGSQNGCFPDMGDHVPGEMGGIWCHPIKLLDGFWLQVDGRWLTSPTAFVAGPFWAHQRYYLGDDLSVERVQFCAASEPGILVRFTFRSGVARRLPIRFLARTDFQEVWPQPEGTATRPR